LDANGRANEGVLQQFEPHEPNREASNSETQTLQQSEAVLETNEAALQEDLEVGSSILGMAWERSIRLG
jgi:hypothetical protein